MKPSLQKLFKIFKLEAERGYDNRAVLGGLDRILDSWEVEARNENLPEDLIQAISIRLRDYPRLSAESRAESLDGLWRRIQNQIEGMPSGVDIIENGGNIATGEMLAIESRQNGPQSVPIAPPQSKSQPRQQIYRSGGRSDVKTYVEGPAALDSTVTVLPGVGPRHAQTLARLGITTLKDMLYYLPRKYVDYSQLVPINRLRYGDEVTVIGTVTSIDHRTVSAGRYQIVEALISDGSGTLRVTWFNQPWMARRMRSGTYISLSGKIDQYLGRLVMNNPEEWEPLEQQQLNTNRIVPVYPLTEQITQRWLRRMMNQVVSYWAPRVSDPLPDEIRRAAGLIDLNTALLQVHFPDSWERLKAARHRLGFDEIFLLQLGVMRQKRAWEARTSRKFDLPEEWLAGQLRRFPYQLTGAQEKALRDVQRDLASGRPMNRLLQGDVGSGKTAIAALAISMVTRHEAQAALMAPTSILAEQHYKNLKSLLCEEAKVSTLEGRDENQVFEFSQIEGDAAPAPLKPDQVRLLLGATPEREKREIQEGLADGSILLVIGTHALIEEPVMFRDLQLIVVDEQHRFGVEQRGLLRAKGYNPHLLVMTATPIPRSLALTIYGDLDLTVVDELPPGRQQVGTYVLSPLESERAYSLIRSQVELGHQAYIVYPLIEETEKSESKAAVDEFDRLQKEIFPRLRLGLLHGRMRPDEKEEVMKRFLAGEYHILVSTTVVEVGIDVPNATVMLIEGANRFGLAQLHQLRGRVGRSSAKSYCILIPETADKTENERLQVMTQTNDGFVLAERDLQQRGPGEFLGTRQSGFGRLLFANLTDVHLIEKARHQAQVLFEIDPDLTAPIHQPLETMLNHFWGGASKPGGQSSKGDIS